MNITFELIIEAVIAVLLLCSLLAIIYAARRSAVGPLPKPDGTELFAVVAAKGSAAQLEQTVKGLVLLEENGELKSRIIIADCGLEERPRKLAELLAGDYARVTVCSPGELPMVLEDCGWTGAR